MFVDTLRLQSPTGATIAWHYEAAQGPPRGIVLIMHGLSEHSKRYAEFAAYLAARGYHAYAHDHRGHGETTAQDSTRGQFAKHNGKDKVIADALAMRDVAVEAHPGLPIILFGHSMGGLIALNVAIGHADKFTGFAIWNADVSAHRLAPLAMAILKTEAIFKGSDTPSTILPRLTFEAWGKKIAQARTPFDWLSNDAEEVARYLADPLCGFPPTVSLWRDVFDLIVRGADRNNWGRIPRTKPLHLVGGADDPATDNGRGVIWLADRLEKAGISEITRIVYPDTRHETLKDHVRGRAMEDFATWAAHIC